MGFVAKTAKTVVKAGADVLGLTPSAPAAAPVDTTTAAAAAAATSPLATPVTPEAPATTGAAPASTTTGAAQTGTSGLTSTMLTGSTGVKEDPTKTSKILLGQ